MISFQDRTQEFFNISQKEISLTRLDDSTNLIDIVERELELLRENVCEGN